MSFTDVSEAIRKPPEWVVENVLPVGLTIIGAPPKSYKSTIVMALAALVTKHRCDALPASMSNAHKHGRTFVFSYEADAGELRYTLEQGLRVKLDPDSGIMVADDPFDWRLDDKDALTRMFAWLNEDVDNKPRLIVLDPLRNFHGLDEKDAGDMIRLIAPLRKWAIENEASVLLVHHTKKPGEMGSTANYDPLDLRGSSALFGHADGVIMLTPKKDSQVHVKAVFKRARTWEANVVFGVYGPSRGYEVLGPQAIGWLKELCKVKLDPHSEAAITARNGKLEFVKECLVRNGYLTEDNAVTEAGKQAISQ